MKPDRLGVVGVGKLGFAIAVRLLEKGQSLWIYNRSLEKAVLLMDRGVEVSRSVAHLLENAETILSVLSDGSVSRELLLKQENDWSGRTLIQMGTIAPRESVEICGAVRERGGRYLEAPVLGSVPQALTGELLIMAAGDPVVFEQCRPVLEILGKQQCRHVGEIGKGAAMKLAFNHLIAVMTAAFAASHRYLEREGADLRLFMEMLRASALYAPTFDKKEKMMAERSFEQANFSLRHLQKDLALVRDAFSGFDGYDEVLSGVDKMIGAAMEKGLSECDYSALYEGLKNSRTV